MKFKLDENLPAELVAELAKAGHEAETVVEEGLQGATDPAVLKRAKIEGRVLLTLDKGIGDIGEYPPGEYSGIVLFRSGNAGRWATIEFVRNRLPELLSMDLDGRLVVVTDRSIRAR